MRNTVFEVADALEIAEKLGVRVDLIDQILGGIENKKKHLKFG